MVRDVYFFLITVHFINDTQTDFHGKANEMNEIDV